MEEVEVICDSELYELVLVLQGMNEETKKLIINNITELSKHSEIEE
ncbi:hypothetical protein [Anaeromicropila herbilytica]|uniref:Uncharacterized protein n=1 Tax=Anaeromicropila herbilytica TaxID=2785025 RepID=A0A7R7ICQ4_9FIRM|nr:hypothetical protein [Anaeromicropila herbilytica]BCN30169.1 hypothetical protein bsdtb5_14640 [Anaeromicropila herbilytica]